MSSPVEERISELDGFFSRGKYEHSGELVETAVALHSLARSLLGESAFVTKQMACVIERLLAPERDLGRTYAPYRALRGAFNGIKRDFEGGMLGNIRLQVRADVEADFLGQAGQLLDEGHKDPAAMVVGAVLEDSLRSLCGAHGISEGSGIEKMNVALRKASVYALPQQQQITAWASIRNKAAHGHFSEYSPEEVRLMHQGVSSFLITFLSP